VNASTWNLCRSFTVRMLSDPARRTLETRPARRVCCAAKPYRSRDAVRGCAVLATSSQKLTFSCRSPYSHGIRSHGRTLSTQYPLTDSNHSTRRLWRLPGSPSNILCTCYTIKRLPCAIGGRMIAPYQSSTLRDVPSRLYGSRRAVNVLLENCAPHCTALAPPPALLVWLHAGVIVVKRFLRHEGL
jgi:hypothetical protein